MILWIILLFHRIIAPVQGSDIADKNDKVALYMNFRHENIGRKLKLDDIASENGRLTKCNPNISVPNKLLGVHCEPCNNSLIFVRKKFVISFPD
jgi:hypothetical protein